MSKKYQNKTRMAQGATPGLSDITMPESVQVATAEIASSMREGLLALAVGAGMQVMTAVLEESVTVLCGLCGKHDAERTAVRHGTEAGSVVLGGRKAPIRRPRVRAADGSAEIAVPAYELFSGAEILDQMAVERMLGKLSTRRYGLGLEPVGGQAARRPAPRRGRASRRSRGGSWPRPRRRWPS